MSKANGGGWEEWQVGELDELDAQGLDTQAVAPDWKELFTANPEGGRSKDQRGGTHGSWVPEEIKGGLGGEDWADSTVAEREGMKALRKLYEDTKMEMDQDKERFDTELRNLREEAMRRECDGLERGDEAGYKRGVAEEKDRLNTALIVCEKVKDRLDDNWEKWTDNIRHNIGLIGVTVARQIVGKVIDAEGELVVGIVERALAAFPVDQPVKLRVNAVDLDLLQEAAEGGLGDGRKIRWVVDGRLERGGFMIEGVDQVADGRLDIALEHAYRRLVGEG